MGCSYAPLGSGQMSIWKESLCFLLLLMMPLLSGTPGEKVPVRRIPEKLLQLKAKVCDLVFCHVPLNLVSCENVRPFKVILILYINLYNIFNFLGEFTSFWITNVWSKHVYKMRRMQTRHGGCRSVTCWIGTRTSKELHCNNPMSSKLLCGLLFCVVTLCFTSAGRGAYLLQRRVTMWRMAGLLYHVQLAPVQAPVWEQQH